MWFSIYRFCTCGWLVTPDGAPVPCQAPLPCLFWFICLRLCSRRRLTLRCTSAWRRCALVASMKSTVWIQFTNWSTWWIVCPSRSCSVSTSTWFQFWVCVDSTMKRWRLNRVGNCYLSRVEFGADWCLGLSFVCLCLVEDGGSERVSACHQEDERRTHQSWTCCFECLDVVGWDVAVPVLADEIQTLTPDG